MNCYYNNRALTDPSGATAHQAERMRFDSLKRRAYEIWLAEGRPDGRAEEHWRQAEMEYAAERSTTPGGNFGTPSIEQSTATVEQRTREQKAIEIELAAAVAERLVGWAKLLAWSIALPTALLIAILATLGVSRYADFVTLVDDTAKRLNDQVSVAERQLATLVQQADSARTRYEDKIASLERGLDATAQQVSRLETGLNEVREKLTGEPGHNIPTSTLEVLQNAFDNFQNWLINLGYKPTDTVIKFAYADENIRTAGYFKDGTIYVREEYISNLDILYREYLHHVLYGKLLSRNFESMSISPDESAIESGVADYLVASFTNNSRPYWNNEVVDLENDLKFDRSRPVERFQTEYIWAATFWEIRKELGPRLADKIIFDAWNARGPGSVQMMLSSILGQVAKSAKPREADIIEILRNRGFSV